MKQFYQLLNNTSSPKNKALLLDEKTIFFLFEKFASLHYGVKGKENIFPESFKDGILYIFVYKSLWHTELSLEKDFFIKTINNEIGESIVQDIKVKRK
jgi:predicted nucleic acid-binding Zn ribbon protein